MQKRHLNIMVILLIIFPQIVSSQHMMKLSGYIFEDKNKNPLSGANIVIVENNKGVSTNSDGYFQLNNLKPGKYTLKISMMGYTTIKKEINLIGNKKTNFYLEEKVLQFSAVEVTAKSEERKIQEQAMPIAVITMRELQGTVSDVCDVLTKASGVKIRSSGGVGSSTRISVRGLEGKRIGFFIDETPLSDNTDFIDVNDIPIDMIERVEIYKGIVPAKFGGSAVGGAVNIVIKEYPPKYVDASYSIQSFNTHKASTVLKRNKGGIEAGIGGFITYSDNNYEMELPLQTGKHITRDHDKFKKITVAAGLSSKIWYFDELEFEPAMIFTEKEIQGIEYNIQEAKSYADAYMLANHNEKTNFLIEGLDLNFDNAYAYTIYRFEDKAMHRYDWDGNMRPPVTRYGGEIGVQPNDVNNKKYTFLQKINLNYIINGQNSINLNSQFNYAKGIPSDTLKDKVVGYKSNFNSSMNSWITGLAHEFSSPNKKSTNVITVKYYIYTMKTKYVDLYGYDDTPLNIDLNKQNYGISNASRYRFTPEFLIKGSAAYDVRLPAENELLGDGFIIAPAVNLEPERNTSFNVGFMYDVTYQKNRLQFEINSFYMQLENMIRFTGGPLQNMYQNFGKMRTIGVETEIKWDATSFLYLWGNITYQDLRDTREFEPGSTVPNPTQNDRIPNIPYFYTNTGFEFHKENFFGGSGQNTRLFADCSFIEEYFYDFEQSIYQERKIPSSLTFNLGLEHSLKNQHIFISIQANNITDAKVLSEFNRPMPGKNIGMKLRYIWN